MRRNRGYYCKSSGGDLTASIADVVETKVSEFPSAVEEVCWHFEADE